MSNLSRRVLLGAGAALAGASVAHAQTPARPPRVRRSVIDPDASNDLQALGYAIGVMKTSTGALSWDRQVQIHAGDWRQHLTWRFLPWHRSQLHWFERIVARISQYPDFAMPYWDWQQTPVLPDLFLDPQSPFFHAERRPDIARVDFVQARAADNRFPNWANLFNDDFGVFAGGPDSAGAVESSGHGFVHVTIDGDMSDPATAPRDPIFFFHHCNIDRVWETWQQGADKRGIPVDPAWLKETFHNFTDERGRLAAALTTAKVIDPLAKGGLGYQYDAPYPYPWFDEQPIRPPAGTTHRELVTAKPVTIALTNTPGAAGLLRVPLAPDVAALLASDKTGQTFELKGKGLVHLEGAHISGTVAKISVRRFGGGSAQSTLMAGAIAFGGVHAMPGMTEALAVPHAHTLGFGVGPQLFDATGFEGADETEVEVEVALSQAKPPAEGEAPVELPLIVGLELDLVINQYRWV